MKNLRIVNGSTQYSRRVFFFDLFLNQVYFLLCSFDIVFDFSESILQILHFCLNSFIEVIFLLQFLFEFLDFLLFSLDFLSFIVNELFTCVLACRQLKYFLFELIFLIVKFSVLFLVDRTGIFELLVFLLQSLSLLIVGG